MGKKTKIPFAQQVANRNIVTKREANAIKLWDKVRKYRYAMIMERM